MNRRDLFKLLGAATVVSAGGVALLDTAKTFFLPPRAGWLAVADMAAVDYVSVALGYCVTYEDIADNLYSFRPRHGY